MAYSTHCSDISTSPSEAVTVERKTRDRQRRRQQKTSLNKSFNAEKTNSCCTYVSVKLSSYRCTREATKHERSV